MARQARAARDRLAEARANLAEGRDKITQEQDQLGQIVVSNYQTGDPSLMGLSMVLTTQDPTELTGQLNSVQNVMDKESVVLDRLEATQALLTVQEREVATAKAERRQAAPGRRREPAAQAGARGARPRPPRPPCTTSSTPGPRPAPRPRTRAPPTWRS